MNILFLVFHGLSSSSGITKKILAQVAGIASCGYTVHLCLYTPLPDGRRVWKVDDQIIKDYGKSQIAKYKSKCDLGCISKYCKDNCIDMVYVRSFHNANPFTIHLFEKLRRQGINVLMEIPTYPYDHEYKNHSFIWKIGLYIDKIFRHSLASMCNKIVTFTDDKIIFGTETIRISNGIDFSQLPLRNDKKNEIFLQKRPLNIIVVAEIHYWHGVDRLLKGVGNYISMNIQDKVDINVHIVGPLDDSILSGGSGYPGLRGIIDEYSLQDHVKLYGPLFGDELNNVFDKCDFAIGSLGRHRSGITSIKTLKNREYAARGFMFAYSETDSDFDSMPYVYKVPADETPVNIKELIDFYFSSSITPCEIRNSITHLSWAEQMKKVMELQSN